MNPAVTNLVISLGAMQLAKKVPFDDPNVLMAVRIGYLTSQAICIGVYLYISYKVCLCRRLLWGLPVDRWQ